MENKLSLYTFTIVSSNRSVDVCFMNDSDAKAHAERLASVNGDITILRENDHLMLVKPLKLNITSPKY